MSWWSWRQIHAKARIHGENINDTLWSHWWPQLGVNFKAGIVVRYWLRHYFLGNCFLFFPWQFYRLSDNEWDRLIFRVVDFVAVITDVFIITLALTIIFTLSQVVSDCIICYETASISGSVPPSVPLQCAVVRRPVTSLHWRRNTPGWKVKWVKKNPD